MTKKSKAGTREWADSNVNIQTGCEHNCKYCYAKCMALRFGRTTIAGWASPKPNQRVINKGFKKRRGRIMFPSSHDITPENLYECSVVLLNMLDAGNEVLIVSKPHIECVTNLSSILKEYKRQIVFRFTIGSAQNEVLEFWEPNAPCFEERLDCLAYAYEQGYQTSVSCEPMLDDNISAVVHAVSPHTTGSIWIGKANRLRQIMSLNCPGDEEVKARADELIFMQNDDHLVHLIAVYDSFPKIQWKDSIKEVWSRNEEEIFQHPAWVDEEDRLPF